jgi:hypothetical protein
MIEQVKGVLMLVSASPPTAFDIPTPGAPSTPVRDLVDHHLAEHGE